MQHRTRPALSVAEDIETIEDHRGVSRFTDDALLSEAIGKLGYARAFSDEALLLIAEGYRRAERQRQRTFEHNKRVAAARMEAAE